MNYQVIYLESIDSTNSYLKLLCREDIIEEGTVILAGYQSNGKGQGTSTWHSSQGMNITMSVLFRPMIRVLGHFSLSEFISLSIIDCLKHFGINGAIKWPNDIYVENKKIAGILVENSIVGDKIVQTVAGIGLNVNERNFPEYIPNPVSMAMILQRNIEINKVLDVLTDNLSCKYEFIKQPGNILHGQYNEKLFRREIQCSFQSENEKFQGTILKVKKSGALVIRKQDSEVCSYMHGEVKMVID